jgi:hypothetical protein
MISEETNKMTNNEAMIKVARLVFEYIDEEGHVDILELTGLTTTLKMLWMLSGEREVFNLYNQARVLELEALLRMA